MSDATVLGQDGRVPSRLETDDDMPSRADLVYKTIASRARLLVLRYLLVSDATSREIVEATGVTEASVRVALRSLEEAGYIAASEPSGQRQGRLPVYALDREQLRADFRELSAYLDPGA